MKRKRISIFSILIIILFLTISTVYADEPPSPPGEVRADDIPIGGNAPVGMGTLFLIGLAAAYGVKKFTMRGGKQKRNR